MDNNFSNDFSKIDIDVDIVDSAPIEANAVSVDNDTVSDKDNNSVSETASDRKKNRKSKILKVFATINAGVAALLLVSGTVFLFAFERSTVSESENRNLSKMPEFSIEALLDGSYTEGVANYINDTVPKREEIKHTAAQVKSYKGVNKDGIKVLTINKGSNGNKGSKETVIEAEVTTMAEPLIVPNRPDTFSKVTEEAAIPEDDKNDPGELSQNIMIYKNRGIMVYYGDYDNGNTYASYVNAYKQDLGENVNVYSMTCPTSISFYWPEASDMSHGSEIDNINNIKDHLVGVTSIDAYSILMDHRDEHIYSRTDHHWQPRGAYYACKAFAKAAVVPFDSLSDYEEVSVPGYVGTLYGFSGAAELRDNPEDFTYYVPPESHQYVTHYYTPSFEFQYDGALLQECYGSSMYLTFMGGDEKIVHVETNAPNNRTLFIIKDSYGNALVPFLTGSFKNIYVVDMRYFNMNVISFMKEHGVTDLLFAMNTFSATGSNFDELERLRTQ